MWEGVTMQVPAIHPTNFGGISPIIRVNYTLDLHVDPSGPSSDLVVSLPLIIGTIPLQEYIKTLAPPVNPKLCNQVRSLSLFRWRTLTLLNI